MNNRIVHIIQMIVKEIVKMLKKRQKFKKNIIKYLFYQKTNKS